MGDRAWLQAKLLVAMGRMGLRGAETEDHASAAFAASVLAFQPLARALLGGWHNGGDGPKAVLSVELLENLSAALGEEVREEELVGVPQNQLYVKIDLRQQKYL